MICKKRKTKSRDISKFRSILSCFDCDNKFTVKWWLDCTVTKNVNEEQVTTKQVGGRHAGRFQQEVISHVTGSDQSAMSQSDKQAGRRSGSGWHVGVAVMISRRKVIRTHRGDDCGCRTQRSTATRKVDHKQSLWLYISLRNFMPKKSTGD